MLGRVEALCRPCRPRSLGFVPSTTALSCLQVLSWCTRHELQDKPHTGRFASVPEWMREVHKRRDKGRVLFLDDMLQVSALLSQHTHSIVLRLGWMDGPICAEQGRALLVL